MRRIPRSDQDDAPPRRRSGWRRLAVLALAPALALSTGTSSTAQGVWVTAPTMPTPRAQVASASATCPEGLRGTCVYAIGGEAAGLTKFEAYSPSAGTWATLPSPRVPRLSAAATTAPCPDGIRGDCVYALGGYGPGGAPALNSVEAYSTETNAWLTVKPLPTARGQAAAATAPCPDGVGLRGECVYVFGGADGGPLDTVEAYSPQTNTWATLTPLQIARFAHGGAAAPCPGDLKLKGTCVYAISGTGAGPLASVEVYSPILNQWQYAADIPTPRNSFGTAAAHCPDGIENGCVYTAGGTSTAVPVMDTFEAYSPVANAWVTLPPVPTGRFGLGSATAHCPKNRHSECVYAVGGSTGAPTGVTEAFAIERDPSRPDEPTPPRPDPNTNPGTPPYQHDRPTPLPEVKPTPATPQSPKPAPKPTPKPTPEPEYPDYPTEP